MCWVDRVSHIEDHGLDLSRIQELGTVAMVSSRQNYHKTKGRIL